MGQAKRNKLKSNQCFQITTGLHLGYVSMHSTNQNHAPLYAKHNMKRTTVRVHSNLVRKYKGNNLQKNTFYQTLVQTTLSQQHGENQKHMKNILKCTYPKQPKILNYKGIPRNRGLLLKKTQPRMLRF